MSKIERDSNISRLVTRNIGIVLAFGGIGLALHANSEGNVLRGELNGPARMMVTADNVLGDAKTFFSCG